ncbi:MAG: MFS transporter [Solibacillus sp.]|uniref:MFS transporter n=1 Tax=unclassified Solibacillus TaxID=2637870 RepID=UPI0030F50766
MPKKTFILLVFIMFLSMTGYGIVLPVLPFFADELGLSSFQMSSLITGWAFTQFLVLPFWGKCIDKFGRKPVLVFGLVGFGFAFLLMNIAQNYIQLLFIRIIGAILSSGTQPAVFAIIADTSEPRERGKAMAHLAAANGLGFLLGPVLGSAFVPFGLSIPFIFAGFLSLITVPFALLFVKEPAERGEIKHTSPLFQSIGHSIKPGYLLLFLITFALALATSSILGILGYFLIEQFQAGATETGWAFTIQSAAAVIIQLTVLSLLYKYFSEDTITKYGILITTIGFACFIITYHISFVFIGVLLIGAGQALIKPTLLALLSKKNELGHGMVMSLHGAYDSLGRSIGPLLAGSLFLFDPVAPFIMSFIICGLLFMFVSFEQRKTYRVTITSKEVS